jgi:hypothetical protein
VTTVNLVNPFWGGGTPGTLTGYTEIVEIYQGATVYNLNMAAFYKRMEVTPDTSVTLGPTFGAANSGGCIIQVWRNISADSPLDVAAVTAGTSNAGNRPNPPAITPVTSGAVIFACGAMGFSPSGNALTQAGSELSDFRSVLNLDNTPSLALAGGHIGWPGGTFDPAGFTGGSTSLSRTEHAFTLALRPSGTAVYVGGKSLKIEATLETDTVVSLTDLTNGVASAPRAGDLVLVIYAFASPVDQDVTIAAPV